MFREEVFAERWVIHAYSKAPRASLFSSSRSDQGSSQSNNPAFVDIHLGGWYFPTEHIE